jgi:hypothetical protein
MNDFDFAVPRDRYADAVEIAEAAGFKLDHDMRHSCDMSYRGNAIDIHISVVKGGSRELNENIWKFAMPMDAFGGRVMIPDNDGLALIALCGYYHNFIFEGASIDQKIEEICTAHPMWIFDILSIKFNWQNVIEIAALSDYDYQARLVGELLNKIVPGAAPLELLERMCPNERMKPFIKRDEAMVEHYNRCKKYA